MIKNILMVVSSTTIVGFSSLTNGATVTSPVGDFDFSVTGTLASDYIWRGQSFSDGPAIQGSVNMNHESGLYAMIWGSNVDDKVFSGSDTEIDYYLGYTHKFTDDITSNLQLSKFTYLNAKEWNSYNIASSISVYGFTLGYKYDIGTSVHPSYTWLGYQHHLPYDMTLSTSYAYGDRKSNKKDYNDWSIGLGKNIFGVNMNLTYTDTNISSIDCRSMYGKDKACASNWTVSMTKTFQ